MELQDFWIEKGQLVPAPSNGPVADELARLHRQGHVHVTVTPESTEVKWALFSPNWASLYFAMEWLATTPGPYVLKYFLAGWFEETYRDVSEACDRISQILAKSDVHLMSRVYVMEADPARSATAVPDLLKHVWEDRQVDPANAIECVFDESSDRFRVDRIGSNSAVARLWGQSNAAFPLISGGIYDQTVSEAYGSVVRTGKPRYDHIYAVMTGPDNSPIWIPYQRIILPQRSASGSPRVSVVSELAPVQIRVI